MVYVLLEQDRPEATVMRRSMGWEPEQVAGQDAILSLPEIGVDVPMREIMTVKAYVDPGRQIGRRPGAVSRTNISRTEADRARVVAAATPGHPRHRAARNGRGYVHRDRAPVNAPAD